MWGAYLGLALVLGAAALGFVLRVRMAGACFKGDSPWRFAA